MSRNESQYLINEISDKIYGAIPDWANSDPIRSDNVEIALRPWSFMLRYPLVDGGAVLLKVARHEEMTLTEAVKEEELFHRTEREYEMLSQIAAVFEGLNGEADQFCYVRPIEIFPEWNALAMEELDAIPLKKYLLRPEIVFSNGDEWKKFEELVEKSGRWLRAYHQGMQKFPRKSLSETHLSGRITHLFGQLYAYMPRKGKCLSELRKSFRNKLKEIADADVSIVMVHGDLHCGNIMVTRDGRVGALDADLTQSPAYNDLAKFYADIETRGIQVLLRGAFLNRAKRRRVYDAILKGYFGEDSEDKFNEAVFRFFIAVAILEKWLIDEIALEQSRGIEALLRHLFVIWRRSYFVRLLKEHIA